MIFILLSFLLTAFCALGFFRFQMIEDADSLFIPLGSKSVSDREILAKILPMNYDQYYLHQDFDLGLFGDVIFITKDHRNIDRMAIRTEVKRIYHLIENINVTYENRTYFYRDLCAKRHNQCVVDGEMFFRETFWQRLKDKQLDRYLLNGMYTDDDAEPNLLSFIFGKKMDLQTKEGKLFSRILKIHFNLRRTETINGTEKNIEVISRMWEQAFLEFFKHFESIMLHTFYSVSNSIDQELAHNISLGKSNNQNPNIDLALIYDRYDVNRCDFHCHDYRRNDLFVLTKFIITITYVSLRRRCLSNIIRSDIGFRLLFIGWNTNVFAGVSYTISYHW